MQRSVTYCAGNVFFGFMILLLFSFFHLSLFFVPSKRVLLLLKRKLPFPKLYAHLPALWYACMFVHLCACICSELYMLIIGFQV